MKTSSSLQANKQSYWLYGRHAVLAALKNPVRRCYRLLLSDPLDSTLRSLCTPLAGLEVVQSDKQQFHKIFGKDVVHQGIALLTHSLPEITLEEIAARKNPTSLLVILDQVTDPHNIGAILRSAAAFGAEGIITTQQPALSSLGVIGKAASGGLEHVPLIKVTNLARTLDFLKEQGFWCVAMDGEAKQSVDSFQLDAPLAVVMGAEGKGLRRLTQLHCDVLLKIPTSPSFGSLNVSNAAAITLFALKHRKTS